MNGYMVQSIKQLLKEKVSLLNLLAVVTTKKEARAKKKLIIKLKYNGQETECLEAKIANMI